MKANYKRRQVNKDHKVYILKSDKGEPVFSFSAKDISYNLKNLCLKKGVKPLSMSYLFKATSLMPILDNVRGTSPIPSYLETVRSVGELLDRSIPIVESSDVIGGNITPVK